MAKLTVLSPLGFPPKITVKRLAQGLGSLTGRKLFLVDVGFESSDSFMAELRAWLAEHQPDVRTEIVRWRDQHRPDPELCARIRAEGDGAILGVGL